MRVCVCVCVCVYVCVCMTERERESFCDAFEGVVELGSGKKGKQDAGRVLQVAHWTPPSTFRALRRINN